MIHLGDITKINGGSAPAVDVIIGGSPCQDLSMAGKRAGLAGERSGLYMEQLRVIKEMRHKDELGGRTGQFIRPRYMVWENVPGAFSCNHGEDFGAVLTEAVRVIEPEAPDVPVPEKGWPTAGVLLGDQWSIAWRVLDAQYWGVPQRRRRISLVCDFGGQSAPEILFVSNSVSGHPEKSRTERERAAEDPEAGAGSPICMATQQGGAEIRRDNKAPCLTASAGMSGNNQPVVCYSGENITSKCNRSNPRPGGPCHTLTDDGRNYVCQAFQNTGVGWWNQSDCAATLRTPCGGDSTKANLIYDGRGNGDGQIAPTITGDHESRITDYTTLCIGNGQAHEATHLSDVVRTLNCMHDQQAIVTAVDCRNGRESQINGTMQAKANGGFSLNCNQVCRDGGTIRRLTPLECERLQGYPDGWTDIGDWVDSKGKKHKLTDGPRYKALGNSIALPPWRWVLLRLCAQYERPATMASLFDGIGGFPLIWESLNGKGSCLWTSEIEEFPMAVTKTRFK